MCYFPLSFLATKVIFEIINGRISLNSLMKFGILLLGSLFVIAVVLAPFLGQNPEWLYPILKKPFARGNLEASVNWSTLSILPGIILAVSLFIFLKYFKTKKREKGIFVLFFGNAFFIFFTLGFFINNIEQYSQAAAMEFYESKANQDVYVEPLFFKSYGQLFYGKRKNLSHIPEYGEQWLMKGPIDKDAYFIIKVHRVGQMEAYPDIVEIGRKNGFVFYHRKALQ